MPWLPQRHEEISILSYHEAESKLHPNCKEKGIHEKLMANICYYFKYSDKNTSLSFQRNKYLSLQSRLIWMLHPNAGGMEMGYGETTFPSDKA